MKELKELKMKRKSGRAKMIPSITMMDVVNASNGMLTETDVWRYKDDILKSDKKIEKIDGILAELIPQNIEMLNSVLDKIKLKAATI